MFEILHRDGLARIGKLQTPHGAVTTPTLMPVINPIDIFITPNELYEKFGAELMMTNAYLTRRHYGEEAARVGIHGVLNYGGPIMTDSGGYQLLRYGVVDVAPEEILRYQEAIGSDIATILDVPTGAGASKERAEETVRVTLERAREAEKLRSKPGVLWCGPVQGGLFQDLVALSAREMGKLDYHLHAVGSPVELLEGYRYREVVQLTMTAKRNLPLDRPVHLFGVGHPMALALGVAMGCDLFDSAAYALYAKDGRYMTVEGTFKLDDLSWFPCTCPLCCSRTPGEVKELPRRERVDFLARHNLYATFAELRSIRQAIVEGRLFELLEQRCRAHPRLLEGLKELMKHSEFIERFDPATKSSAFFYLGPESAKRPEVLRHRRRMREYVPPPLKNLVLYLSLGEEPRPPVDDLENSHFVKIVPPFGPVPEELEELYPLWQHEVPRELDDEAVKATVEALREYLENHGRRYERIILVANSEWVNLLRGAYLKFSDKLTIQEK